MKNYFERILMTSPPFFLIFNHETVSPAEGLCRLVVGAVGNAMKRVSTHAVASIILLCSPAPLWAVPIIEAEAYVASPPIGGSSIFWVDNDTVIFKGMPVRPASKEISGERLLQFKVSQRKLTDLGSLGGGLCVSDGSIRYWRPTPETQNKPLSSQQSEWFAGPIGKETKAAPPPPKSEWMDETQGCKFNTELPPLPDWMEAAKKEGRLFKRLRPEHGWVEAISASPISVRLTKLYPSSSRQSAINLKTLDLPVSLTLVYYPFKRAYLVTSSYHQSPLPAGVLQKLWWLYPDGQLEEITSVNRDERSWPLTNVDIWNFVLTRNGVYFSGAEPQIDSRIGKSGLYRLNLTEPPEKIINGRIGSKAVSPDGCRIAFGNDNRWTIEGNESFRLQVIDVCKGKSR